MTKVQAPTPAGQTARTTSVCYDSMDRLTVNDRPARFRHVDRVRRGRQRSLGQGPDGRIGTTVLDALNRPVVAIDADGQSRHHDLRRRGKQLTVTDALNRTTSYTYSVRGWLATVTDPMGYATTYIYTATGKEAAQDETGTAAASSRCRDTPTTPTIARSRPRMG